MPATLPRPVRMLLCALASCALPSVATARAPAVAAEFDQCFDRHAARFGLDADLLRGIARVESGMRPSAINNTHFHRTNTRDIGLMQINTSLLPRLARFGITEADLLQPCTSIEVGAWVLSDVLRRHGNTWTGVGAYNAACTKLQGQACTDARARYAWAVFKKIQLPQRTTAAAPQDRARQAIAEARSPVLLQVVRFQPAHGGAAQ